MLPRGYSWHTAGLTRIPRPIPETLSNPALSAPVHAVCNARVFQISVLR